MDSAKALRFVKCVSCEALQKNKTLEWLVLSNNNISLSDPVRKKLKEAHGDRIIIFF